jgi:hypothetical protein
MKDALIAIRDEALEITKLADILREDGDVENLEHLRRALKLAAEYVAGTLKQTKAGF